MFRARQFAAVLIVLFVPSLARAANIHVNNLTGDDRFNGLTSEVRSQIDGPVATIARALEIALATDSIVIANAGAPYTESLLLSRPELSGSETYPFVIEGNGATLRGARPLPLNIWRHTGGGVYRYQPYRKAHYQLVVNGQVAREVPVASGADAVPALEPLEWCAHRGFVYFRVEPFKFITDYEFEAPALEVGIGLHNVRHLIVQNLNVELFRLDGVAVTGNSRSVRLLNGRSTSNGRAGLSVAGSSEVMIGGMEFANNRVAERLVLLKGRVADLPDSAVPPKPAPMSWDLDSGRYVRILSPDAARQVMSTANAGSAQRK